MAGAHPGQTNMEMMNPAIWEQKRVQIVSI